MERSWIFLLGIFLSLHVGLASKDTRRNNRNRILSSLLERKIRENIGRRGNVHGHIVSVNEAHEEARRGISDTTAIEEEIIASNGDPNRRPSECNLFEGDLCLDPEDMNLVTSDQDRKRNVIKNRDKLWPNLEVYYTLDSNLNSLRPLINQAISRFEDKTCLVFREVDSSYESDHIRIFKGNGCWSKVGRSGGRQLLSLGSGCEYMGVILHELMHAVGIWHEQSRPDRDDYVTVLWDNIQSGKENKFGKYQHGQLDQLNLPYDYESLMHYDSLAYSVDGRLKTIVAKGREYMSLGGEVRGTFTQNDIRELNALYNC